MIVQILLSTYNGTKYIIPLMESLLGQDYPHMEILVRDDGSNDGTVELLREYAANHTNIKVVTGVNLGFARSFFKLLEISSPTLLIILPFVIKTMYGYRTRFLEQLSSCAATHHGPQHSISRALQW